MYSVYGLYDPRDNSIRYIGITMDVYQRMRQHSRCEGDNESKNAWIRELQGLQLMFYTVTLEQIDTFSAALEREAAWINHYLSQGADLTNISGRPCLRQEKVLETRIPQPVGLRKASKTKIYRLFFDLGDGRVTRFLTAPNFHFDQFVRPLVPLDERITSSHWDSTARRQSVLDFAEKQGIALPFCTPQGREVWPEWYMDQRGISFYIEQGVCYDKNRDVLQIEGYYYGAAGTIVHVK